MFRTYGITAIVLMLQLQSTISVKAIGLKVTPAATTLSTTTATAITIL